MMVNSSYYGLNRKIDNLRLAIVLLGFNEVRNIAIQSGFLKAVSDLKSKLYYDRKKLWTHSYFVSICAEGFVSEDDPKKAGTFMTMGILHDIGKFALQSIGEMMEQKGMIKSPIREFSSDLTTLANEQNVFGVTHTVIGCLLGERWNLSDRVCAVIEYHHHPSFFSHVILPEEFLEDISAVCIADLVVNTITEESRLYKTPDKLFFDAIGYSPPLGTFITDELKEKLERAREYAEILG
jgi:HD-like signal output (HDOD) protein